MRVRIKLSGHLIAVVALFAVVGVITATYSSAATTATSAEAESGSRQGTTRVVQDGLASGGGSVRFGEADTVAWPSPTSITVCGNKDLLDGPSLAPSGAFVVRPGDDLAALTMAQPAGTLFYITAGIYTLPNGPIGAKAGNQYIGAPGAVIDGQYSVNYQGQYSVAFRGSAAGITIKYLTIRNFGASTGKMAAMVNKTAVNWSQAGQWTIANNTISNNGGSGVWVVSDSKVVNNCVEGNEQTGVGVPSVTMGRVRNVTIEHNEIRNNNRSGAIETAGVCTGCSGGIKIWNASDVVIKNNAVNNNNGTGIWADNNCIDILIDANVVRNNQKRGIMYEISYNAIISRNYVAGNYVELGASSGSYPHAGIYISESGGDEAVAAALQAEFSPVVDVYDNYVVDNWNGILLWENSGRYCTQNDTQNCPPLVTDPTSQCVVNLAANADTCRWKTQNVRVHNNTFEMTSASNGWCPQTNTNCGRNALSANSGPVGTPYAGAVIQENITRHQNNRYYDNTYIGTWHFSIPEPSRVINVADWQALWSQDDNSVWR